MSKPRLVVRLLRFLLTVLGLKRKNLGALGIDVEDEVASENVETKMMRKKKEK